MITWELSKLFLDKIFLTYQSRGKLYPTAVFTLTERPFLCMNQQHQDWLPLKLSRFKCDAITFTCKHVLTVETGNPESQWLFTLAASFSCSFGNVAIPLLAAGSDLGIFNNFTLFFFHWRKHFSSTSYSFAAAHVLISSAHLITDTLNSAL